MTSDCKQRRNETQYIQSILFIYCVMSLSPGPSEDGVGFMWWQVGPGEGQMGPGQVYQAQWLTLARNWVTQVTDKDTPKKGNGVNVY